MQKLVTKIGLENHCFTMRHTSRRRSSWHFQRWRQEKIVNVVQDTMDCLDKKNVFEAMLDDSESVAKPDSHSALSAALAVFLQSQIEEAATRKAHWFIRHVERAAQEYQREAREQVAISIAVTTAKPAYDLSTSFIALENNVEANLTVQPRNLLSELTSETEQDLHNQRSYVITEAQSQ